MTTKKPLSRPSMCWEDNQRHTVLAGMASDEFGRQHTKYEAYYLVHDDKVVYFHQGTGRPFATCCTGCRREFGDYPIHIVVGVPEDLKPGSTPVLGYCGCITCLQCVYSMPLEYDIGRRCRGCHAFGHQHEYHMYPVTAEGIRENTDRAFQIIRNKNK
jgi:hypothetical protein